MEGGESRLAHVLLQWPLLVRHAFAVSWHLSRFCPPLDIGSIMSLLMCLCQNDRPRTIRIQNIRDERTATNNRRQNNIHEEQQYTFCAEENGATSVGRGCHQSEGILGLGIPIMRRTMSPSRLSFPSSPTRPIPLTPLTLPPPFPFLPHSPFPP